jgi:TonB family protein
MKKSILLIAVFFGTLFTSEAQVKFNELDTAPIYGSCEDIYDNAQRCFTQDITKTILANVTYPEKTKAKNISGVVYVNFTIDETDAFVNPHILRGVEKSLNEATLNAVKDIKPFTSPGIKGGVPVAVQYTKPIKFALK